MSVARQDTAGKRVSDWSEVPEARLNDLISRTRQNGSAVTPRLVYALPSLSRQSLPGYTLIVSPRLMKPDG